MPSRAARNQLQVTHLQASAQHNGSCCIPPWPLRIQVPVSVSHVHHAALSDKGKLFKGLNGISRHICMEGKRSETVLPAILRSESLQA